MHSARSARGTPRARAGLEPGALEQVADEPVESPRLLEHAAQAASVVSFEDSSGAVLQEITTLGGAKDTLAHAPRARGLTGEWISDKLRVQRPGHRGTKMTETSSLEDNGDLLVIRTKIESSGDLPAREFKRAWRRVKD